MELKILHTADLHLDSPFASFSPELQSKLRSIQRTIPDKLLEISKHENCNMWLIAGDLFDEQQYSRESFTALRRVLEECNVPVFISPGNHDYCSSESPWLREKWPSNVYIFKGEIEAVSVPNLDCIVYGAGFQSMDSESMLTDFQSLEKASHKIMVMHGDPIHIKSPYNAVTGHQVQHSGLNYIALGHVHTHGSFLAGKTLCAWPGCPMGRGWDETDSKGVYIVSLSSDTKLDYYPLDTPRFHDAVLKNDHEIQNFFKTYRKHDFYRLTVTGKKTGETSKFLETISAYSNIWSVDKTIKTENPWDLLDEDSFRGDFFRILNARLNDASDSETEIVNLAAEIATDILSGIEVDIP